MAHSFGDITIANESGVFAIVEVKNASALNFDVAAQLVDEIPSFVFKTGQGYAMVVSQDRGFLWRLEDGKPPSQCEAWELNTSELLARYMDRVAAGTRLQYPELWMIVNQWISDLSDHQVDVPQPWAAPLIDSGFLDAIRSPGVTSAAVVA
jgi:hypothetical protein